MSPLHSSRIIICFPGSALYVYIQHAFHLPQVSVRRSARSSSSPGFLPLWFGTLTHTIYEAGCRKKED
jgi:hypothetical protein